jgi:hypothetical protein
MENPFKLFLKITTTLEGFTHIVPVPMAVYFTMAVGAFKSEREAIGILVSGFICGTIMISIGSAARYYRLRRVFGDFEKNSDEYSKSEDLKINLLNQPFFEAKVIALRWIAGVPVAHCIYILFWGVETDLHISIPFVMMFTAPISYIAHLFITERIIENYLKKPEFININVNLNSKRIQKMSYFKRILVSLFSIVSMPFILLGYFLYASFAGYVHIQNPLPHIAVLGLSTFIPLIITALYLASSMRKGLHEVEETISDLTKGNFDRYLPIISTNEFARQGSHINSVISSLKDMYTQLKDLNENLEKKVTVRTEELMQTLEEVKALKFKQDGDYFLTALLLRPFIKSKIKSSYLTMEYSIKQKKEFEFNERFYEIGGDLCFSEFIYLKGKEYVLIVNADAMGKSIQGAGGILVLGAVLKSAIERNSLVTGGEDFYPEIWLKNLYIELHRVFVAFEGSMLVSLVMGLIEKDSGLYFYINAEHPWSVLFRDGKASFLETDIKIHKLGFELENREVTVIVVQLHQDDTIFIGSDGKDDILYIDSEKKTMNEDETVFLRMIEECKGDIKGFSKRLQDRGEIIDDISILKFTYMNPVKTILDLDTLEYNSKSLNELLIQMESEKSNFTLHKFVSEKLFEKKVYSQVIQILEPILPELSDSIDNFFLLAYSYYKLNSLERSVEYAERVRVREPYLIKNLILLSDIYFTKGEFRKALVRIDDAIKKDKNSSELLIRKEKIKNRL